MQPHLSDRMISISIPTLSEESLASTTNWFFKSEPTLLWALLSYQQNLSGLKPIPALALSLWSLSGTDSTTYGTGARQAFPANISHQTWNTEGFYCTNCIAIAITDLDCNRRDAFSHTNTHVLHRVCVPCDTSSGNCSNSSSKSNNNYKQHSGPLLRQNTTLNPLQRLETIANGHRNCRWNCCWSLMLLLLVHLRWVRNSRQRGGARQQLGRPSRRRTWP